MPALSALSRFRVAFLFPRTFVDALVAICRKCVLVGMYVLGMYVSPPPSPHPSPRGRFGRLLLSVGGGYPATGFSRSSVDSRPRRFVARTVLSLDNIGTSHQHFTFRLSHNQQNPKPTFDLARRASRLPNYILQCSFFFFARMSCSEQSAFHGQAADPVWFFSELLFQSVAAKKKKKKKKEKKKKFLCNFRHPPRFSK